MGCGCGGKKSAKRPVVTPKNNPSVEALRAMKNQPTVKKSKYIQVSALSNTSGITAKRREVERKRRQAILRKLGR